jgi:hypothetical protein
VTIPRRVGCPIRISTDQSLLAAPRGFSQRATSFIASWCQGIHRMPLSYSDPVVRLSRQVAVAGFQRRPIADRDSGHDRRNHRRSRTRGEPRSSPGSFRLDLNHLRHGTRMSFPPLRRLEKIRIHSHNVSEHSPSDLGARGRPQNPNRALHTRHTLPVRHQSNDAPSSVHGRRGSETSDNRQLKTDD